VNQIESRTNAFGDRARVYMECTVSNEDGRTWRELKQGTDSRICLECPHCKHWVTPERQNLTGWQDAKSVMEAREAAALNCPSCGCIWTEGERSAANQTGRLVHNGQQITEDGTIVGLMPRTLTLGFRFTAANNLLVTMPRVAEEEWTAPRTTDPDLAEKKLRQFFWTLPSEAETVITSEIDAGVIAQRIANFDRGQVPADANKITVGIDIGKWLCHWVALAWRGGTPHVIEYGRIEVPSQTMAVEQAILTALRSFRDEVLNVGWPSLADGRQNMRSSLTLVDSGNWEATIVSFCGESGAGFLPAKGFGVEQIGRRKAMFEPGYEVVAQPAGHNLMQINSDRWKTEVHNRLQTPVGQPGGLTLFKGTANEHLSFAKHHVAERKGETFISGRGLAVKWETLNRNNHFFDADALAHAAGHGVGERLIEIPKPQPATDRAEFYNPVTAYKGRY
jgi:phage terminase large subunit GpA-like protein